MPSYTLAFVEANDPVGRAVQWATRSRHSHVFVAVEAEDLVIYEALREGIRKLEGPAARVYLESCGAELVECEGDADDVARAMFECEGLVGRHYGLVQCGTLWLRVLLRLRWFQDDEHVCSTLAALFAKVAGHPALRRRSVYSFWPSRLRAAVTR